MVSELLCCPLTVGELATNLNISQYNVSRHLRVLREAGIVECERKGSQVHCRVEDGRRVLHSHYAILDLGCCTFRFDWEDGKPLNAGST